MPPLLFLETGYCRYFERSRSVAACYTLTPMGEEVGRKVESLADWIEDNLPRIMQGQQKS